MSPFLAELLDIQSNQKVENMPVSFFAALPVSSLEKMGKGQWLPSLS